MTRYVTVGRLPDGTPSSATQLAELVGPERQHGTDGYQVIPLDNGMTGDGYGYPVWVAHVAPADMTQWQYSPARNTWTRTLASFSPPASADRLAPLVVLEFDRVMADWGTVCPLADRPALADARRVLAAHGVT